MKKRLKMKDLGVVLLASVSLLLTACNSKDSNETPQNESNSEPISVISREQGSGTRTAFVEITGILEKNDSGEETDNTSEEATVQNSTEAVLNAVSNDKNAIGYVSLGSLNDTVKSLLVDGVEATAANVKDGSYKIQRPFNIVYKDGASAEVLDFLKYIESDEGQKVIEEMGYVSDVKGITYEALDSNAKITIAGSTSITPLMEKLTEAYKVFNPNFQVDIQATGSSAGVKSVQEDSAEIGMVSRELKDSESDLKSAVIARDGIAVIVNKEAEVEDLSLEKIKDIFEGTQTSWK
ncbi:phosphate ABC transporter substrate-binding protein, PhoT family (TC 3.A.1.7.1) [Anaerosphaera aminiphila DSM 21120]|uniref:Phosphate ABC transporter substrate-binding protein, PhoT family (TC 3.A.1.7.1) n=1 Tax=Anaerosphaera aminiphila DSM 21120 TaxID=1120995 RepID=A0A1M5QN43_9FIRM|nr:substrate-binding domain-containing protein [Anaerosphaera aminiphila]SHH15301.1 phosphate ABC transporter substrate-binding protein, PhoT family (TC 3.A.1.7.1) [Anaerosphaera aminiphila DSM 21120]